MKTDSRQFQQWLKRNEEQLRAEYRTYRISHDYSPDGSYIANFEAYARFEYDNTAWHRARELELAEKEGT